MDDDFAALADGELKARAWTVLRTSGGDPRALAGLASELERRSLFKEARRILERARDNPEGQEVDAALRLRLTQRHALCTYKDPDIPAHEALDRAFAILAADAELLTTRDQETLGIAGAIAKRKYQVDGAKEHLEAALSYYLRGHAGGAAGDRGYNGINAAYVLDLLAFVEEAQGRRTGAPDNPLVAQRRAEARRIRRQLVEDLAAPELEAAHGGTWWFRATQAEAHFGLGGQDDPAAVPFAASGYGRALELLQAAREACAPAEWEFESTARQLASLALAQGGGAGDIESSRAWETLRRLLRDEGAEAVRSVFYGKLGLGLSGGGFRASLFHLGVLARLAELDLLRHVHVVSCVSGGSIVGAHYYLEVRRLLMAKRDEEITRQDYVEIVERMTRHFVAGVQRNLRTRLLGSLRANLRMMFSGRYSRTERLGELIEENIYALIGDDGRRSLDELMIHPAGTRGFVPKRHNWLRRNKVPILVLNATSLNTGHNWQFTASFMGESPFAVDDEIDGNWRLRRLYYRDAPAAHQRVPLGKAVGASACVPGLFEPVALAGLYPKDRARHPEMVVRLVDGGVHDNQGVVSLLEQDCSVLVCSDASGQMTSDPEPAGGVLGPLLRTNAALMERVRQAQFQDLRARQRSGLLKGVMILHLKKAFEVEPIDWTTCEEPAERPRRRGGELLPYEVRREIQSLLAGMRTDLDSFSDIEAQALMTSGYLMAGRYADDLGAFPRGDAAPVAWDFLRLAEPLRAAGRDAAERALSAAVGRSLAVADRKAFKVWRLWRPLQVASWVLAAAAGAGIVWALWSFRHRILVAAAFGADAATTGAVPRVLTVGDVAAWLLWLGLPLLVGGAAAKLLRARQTLRRVLLGGALAVCGWLVAQVHLRVFDRLFLRLGRLRDDGPG